MKNAFETFDIATNHKYEERLFRSCVFPTDEIPYDALQLMSHAVFNIDTLVLKFFRA